MNNISSIQTKQLWTKLILTLGVFFFLSQNTVVRANSSKSSAQNQENTHQKAQNTMSLTLKKHPIAFISSIIGSMIVGGGIIIGVRYMQKKSIDTTKLDSNHGKQSSNATTSQQNRSSLKEANKLMNLGKHLFNKKKYKSSVNYYKQALAIYQNQLDLHHEKCGDIFYTIGWINKCQEKYQKALKNYQEALKIYQKRFGKNHKKYAQTLFQISWIYNQKKNIAPSNKHFLEAKHHYQEAQKNKKEGDVTHWVYRRKGG